MALGVVLALHGVFAAVVWWEMRPRPVQQVVRVRLGDALQVRFIDATPAPAPSPPPLPLPSPPPAAPRPAREPPARTAMTARLPAAPASAPSASAPPQLFDRTGQPLLPALPAAKAKATPGYVQRKPQGDAQVMSHDVPIEYQATRFNENFPSPHETILGQALRGAMRTTHTGEKKDVSLGRGIHLKCKTLFGVPTPFCAVPPAPPSKKDGDERLNMAPAPLVKELAPKPRKLSECIALYRAGKPLPHGCPVDTPDRAVDAECGEAREAGQPLPPHCRKP